MLIEKFSVQAQAALELAGRIAVKSRHRHLTPAHVLSALLDTKGAGVDRQLKLAGGDVERLRAAVETRLRHVPNAEKRIVLMLSAYPTKHARIGNAVGLDTPASAVRLLRAMGEAGYDVGEFPGVAEQDGDALIHALIEAGGQDPDWLTEEKLAGNPVRISTQQYRSWFETLPDDFRKGVHEFLAPELFHAEVAHALTRALAHLP